MNNFVFQCSWEGKGCGKYGRQRRKIHCLDEIGAKVRKKYCKRFLARKPKRARKCSRKICEYSL